MVQELDEEFDAFIFLDVLKDLDSIYFFLLVIPIELNLASKIFKELLLVAIFAQINIFEFDQPILAQPSQAVLVPKGSLLLSPPLEDPKLVIFLDILLFFRVSPSIIAYQTPYAFPVSYSLADLVGLFG